jgi:hypothetical protein
MTQDPLKSSNSIESSILINAHISKVRSILTDFASYPTWSAYVKAIEPVDNPLAPVGTKLKISVLMGGRASTMNETVIQNDEGGFAWGGQIVTPAVFAAKHLILLTDEGAQTKLVQRDEFKGVMIAPMKWLGFGKQIEVGQEEFAAALRKKAEES